MLVDFGKCLIGKYDSPYKHLQKHEVFCSHLLQRLAEVLYDVLTKIVQNHGEVIAYQEGCKRRKNIVQLAASLLHGCKLSIDLLQVDCQDFVTGLIQQLTVGLQTSSCFKSDFGRLIKPTGLMQPDNKRASS